MGAGRQQWIEQSDLIREEAVAEPRGGGGGTDDLVPSARQQEGEESMGRVGGFVHNPGGFVDGRRYK